MPPSLPTRIAISPDALFQELDGETVLVDPHRGIPHGVCGLDNIGSRMWQLLAEHGNVATAVEQLLAEYDMDEATLYRDLANLIAELTEEGLLIVQT
jgi:hypothetical protein